MSKHQLCQPAQNHLLHGLPPEDRAAIEPFLTRAPLEQHQVIVKPDTPIDTAWFPISGVGSILAQANGRQIEIGLFGCEGMSHIATLLGDDRTPHEVVIQVPGEGMHMPADRLRELMDARPALRRHMLRYVQSFTVQMGSTALSNGQSRLEERLARWLLMCHDRIGGDTLRLTHDFLSIMLGVRRAGVTVGTHLLEGKGLIRANRGSITITDREGLEEEAGATYGTAEREYDRLVG